jgi:Zinc dependent phospholipase C
MNVFRTCLRALVLALCWIALLSPAGAYSVLSHEEVVDMAWLPHIVPLLRARYPGLSDDDLRKAHAYAYGGSVIQDIGYYPFGSHEFSDLLHYVRTGDFVLALLREATNANEYAFALGALAHYCGDVDGHPLINQVTADEYPKLRRRFGPVVTYGENPIAHLRTEFGFDVVQVAHGRYSQENYRDFIGFQVAKELLEKAFLETYGVPVDTILKHEDLAIGSYRRSVSTLIPKMTTVALVSYKDQIEKENPGFDHKKFVYRLRRTEYEQEYGKAYAHPGIGSRVMAFLVRILPKVGPLKALEIKVPNAAEQDLYLKGMNRTVDMYDGYLHAMTASPEGAPPDLHEIDLDTGKPSRLGEYRLADQAYGKLLAVLVNHPQGAISPDVQRSLADFYAVRTEPEWYARKPKEWRRLAGNLERLDALPKPIPAAVTSSR